MYQGEYHGKKHHEADVDSVVQRALDVGCTKLMITGSDLLESDRAVHQARAYREPAPLCPPSSTCPLTLLRSSRNLFRDRGRAPLLRHGL